MRIIFVRHGQTTYNHQSRYQGHTDSVLSELGRRQAMIVAARLNHETIDAVYSSDLSRAADTAETIASRHDLRVHHDERLRECSFGDWEGLTVTEIAEQYTELYSNYRRDSRAFRAPNGERLEELQERVVDAVNDLAECHLGETVCVATHGGPIRAFFCYAMGTTLDTFRKIGLDNCGITTFSLDSNNRWFLEVLNDTYHLSELEVLPHSHDETSIPGRAR